MAYKISKTITATRVSYQTVVVNDGVPQFVEQPDAVFRGSLTQERVIKMLKERLGSDQLIVITKIDNSQHRYVMDLEQFVLNAQITDDKKPDEGDEGESSADIEASDDELSSNDNISPSETKAEQCKAAMEVSEPVENCETAEPDADAAVAEDEAYCGSTSNVEIPEFEPGLGLDEDDWVRFAPPERY